jgi:hypothetical protein
LIAEASSLVPQDNYKEIAKIGMHYAMDELGVVRGLQPGVRIRKDPQDKDYDLHVHVPSITEVLHVSTRIS